MTRFEGIKRRIHGITDEEILDLFKATLNLIPHTEHCLRYMGYDGSRGSEKICRCGREKLEAKLNELSTE